MYGKWFVGPAAAAVVSIAWMWSPEYLLFQVCTVLATALIVLGLVVVCGVAGQITLAQSAFAAIGAYVSAVLSSRYALPLATAIPLATAAAGAVGYVLGLATLRVAGHYLALATMAFTAVVQIAVLNLDGVTGGASGMPMPMLTVAGVEFDSARRLGLIVLPVFALCWLLVHHLMHSRFGRGYDALRHSEVAAAAMGIDVLRYKAGAFALGAALGALGGALLAMLTTYLDPAQYGITQAVHYLAIAVVGGVSVPAGALMGSMVFVLLPEALQGFQSRLGLVFAVLVLLFVTLLPKGLVSLPAEWRRRRQGAAVPVRSTAQ